MQIVLAVLVTASACYAAQSSDDKISMFRAEIEILEKRINQTEAGKQGIISQLQNIDRKMELHRQVVRELERRARDSGDRAEHLKGSINKLENRMDILSQDLLVEEANLTTLRQETGKRIAYLYKHMAGNRLALLLGAANLNDLSRRQRYIKAVAQYDGVRLDNLKRKRNQVHNDRRKLGEVRRTLTFEQARRLSELERVRKLISSRRTEERELLSEKSRKQDLLHKVANDTELLRALLDERRRALEQIEWEIRRLVSRRPPVRKVWQPDVPFTQLYGSLPWPLERRRVTHPFGRILHPELGTTTINPGVDLEAKPGDPVFAVARGQVTKISWLRGFGNTVILSHSDGYYTVYARLGNIFVSEGDIKDSGQSIGEVGDSGTESNLHFEVWSNRNKQDPLRWLQ